MQLQAAAVADWPTWDWLASHKLDEDDDEAGRDLLGVCACA